MEADKLMEPAQNKDQIRLKKRLCGACLALFRVGGARVDAVVGSCIRLKATGCNLKAHRTVGMLEFQVCILYYTIPYDTIPHMTPYYTMRYFTILHSTMPYYYFLAKLNTTKVDGLEKVKGTGVRWFDARSHCCRFALVYVRCRHSC